MKKINSVLIVLLYLSLVACGDNHQAAEKHLSNARNFLAKQEFENAKAEIDSVNILYPSHLISEKPAFLSSIPFAGQRMWH